MVRYKFEVHIPAFKYIYLKSSILEDESNFVKYRGEEDYEFHSFDTSDKNMEFSSWTHFPTPENPTADYKYVSLHFFIDRQINSISRETYGLLDWIGDCGGLYEALNNIGSIIMFPYSTFAL